MEPLDEQGLFWLIDHEEDKLSGRLQFDHDDGIRLALVGIFDHDLPEQDEAFIAGWVGSKPVTLASCYRSNRNEPVPGVGSDYYSANRLFIGHHFQPSDLQFQSASVQFSHINEWVGRTGITEGYPSNYGTQAGLPDYTLEFRSLEDEEATFSRGRVRLGFDWSHRGSLVEGVTLTQRPVLNLEYSELQPLDVIRRDIDAMQDLASLCMDVPLTTDRFDLRRPDIRVRMLSGDEIEAQQPIELRAPLLRYEDPQTRKKRHQHQMLLTFDQIGGVEGVARWLDECHKFRRTLDSLMSIRHAKQMFAENRFMNVTSAAEAFHRTMIGGEYMDRAEFVRLYLQYVRATPKEHRGWLRGRLEHSNDVPLAKRLRQLASQSSAATRTLIGGKSRWAYTVASVRNDLTHLGSDDHQFDGGDLVWLTESVFSVVRVCMLQQIGVDQAVLSQLANNAQATWFRGRLMASIEAVRTKLRSSNRQ